MQRLPVPQVHQRAFGVSAGLQRGCASLEEQATRAERQRFGRQRLRPVEHGDRLFHLSPRAQQLRVRNDQRERFLGERLLGDRFLGGFAQAGRLFDPARAQGRERHHRAGFHAVGARRLAEQVRQARHLVHRLVRPVKVGQAQHPVQQQHPEQVLVRHAPAALDAFVDVLQRLVVVAELQQFVGEIAEQDDIEAVSARGVRFPQGLVEVRKRLGRIAAGRMATRDDVQHHAALFGVQHLHALVAQGHHAAERLQHLALAPVAARLAHLRHDFAAAIAAGAEAALGGFQFDQRLRRGVVAKPVVPQRQARPPFGLDVSAGQRPDEGLLGERQGTRRVGVLEFPGLTGATKRRRGWLPGARRHPRILLARTRPVKPQKTRFSGPRRAVESLKSPFRPAPGRRRARSGGWAPDTATRRLKMKNGTPPMPIDFIRASASARLFAAGCGFEVGAGGLGIAAGLAREPGEFVDDADVHALREVRLGTTARRADRRSPAPPPGPRRSAGARRSCWAAERSSRTGTECRPHGQPLRPAHRPPVRAPVRRTSPRGTSAGRHRPPECPD